MSVASERLLWLMLSMMDSFPPRLRSFTVALVLGGSAVSLVGLMRSPGVAATPLIVLGALAIASEHQRVRLPNGMLLSPGFMVGMTAIVVFRDTAWLAGPMIVGASMGVPTRHFGPHGRGWIAFNAANFALATGSAAALYHLIPVHFVDSLPLGILAVIPCALAVVAVESVVVAASYWFEDRSPLRECLGSLVPALVQAIPFAFVGFFLGHLYLDLGWPIVMLLLVPIILMRGVFTSYLEMRATNEATMQVLVRALELKDSYTAGHAERVATYARYIGEELGLPSWRLDRLRSAALMHDIGKLVVPNQLLNKPGKLSAEEFAVVRRHEQVTVEMLEHIDFLRPIAVSVSGDHSHFGNASSDGSIEAFAIAVADAYDAMTSTRSYRRALSQEVAMAELLDKAGTQFHPECVTALRDAIARRGERHGAGYEASAEAWQVTPPAAGLGSAGLGDLSDGLERV